MALYHRESTGTLELAITPSGLMALAAGLNCTDIHNPRRFLRNAKSGGTVVVVPPPGAQPAPAPPLDADLGSSGNGWQLMQHAHQHPTAALASAFAPDSLFSSLVRLLYTVTNAAYSSGAFQLPQDIKDYAIAAAHADSCWDKVVLEGHTL